MVVSLDRRRKIIQIAVALTSGIILAYIYSSFSEQLRVSGILGLDFVLLLIFLIGLQIGICSGILLDEETRAIGVLLLFLFLSIAIMSWKYVGSEFLIGLLIGVFIVILAMWRNQLNLLPDSSRILITFFFLCGVYYLYNVFLLEEADVKIIAICTGLLLGAYIGLVMTVKGSGKGSSVFAIGSGKSGKTVLAGCIYNDILYKRDGVPEDQVMLTLGGEDMTLDDILRTLSEGEWPLSTRRTEARFFKLSAKKRWITPVRVEFVDFGGEHFSNISKYLSHEKYDKFVEEIGKELKAVLEVDIPKEAIGTLDFMQRIMSRWEEEEKFLEKLREKIVLAYICRSIMDAEKLIFLIDGMKVKNFIDKKEKKELTDDCGVYREIMKRYKEKKKYRLVITKTDELDELIERRFYKNRRTVKGEDVEKWLLGEMEKGIPAFKGITARGKTVDAKLHSVCLETYKDEWGDRKPLIHEGGTTLWNYDDFIKGIL